MIPEDAGNGPEYRPAEPLPGCCLVHPGQTVPVVSVRPQRCGRYRRLWLPAVLLLLLAGVLWWLFGLAELPPVPAVPPSLLDTLRVDMSLTGLPVGYEG